MREYLFRGKRVDNGEWIYGDLLTPTDIMYVWEISENTGMGNRYDIYPKTVGKYIDMTDKNGTKIFEGDIVRNNDNEKGVVRRAYYDPYSRYVFGGYHCVDKTAALVAWKSPYQIEVIGNIHDNPELLEVKE